MAKLSASRAPLCVRTSAEWVSYFEANAARLRATPWHLGDQHMEPGFSQIAASLRGWQLGETSDGSHLLAAARSYAERLGDPTFLDAVRLFIREEQRHGEDLGRCLDLAGVPRAERNWGDSCFRAVRYARPSMETWATPVVMVETHAMVYYDAIRRATASPVLRAVCRQILADEVPHLRFQCERLAILHRERPAGAYALTMLLHRILFAGITLAVWVGHARVFRAAGIGFGKFWRSAWTRMRRAWRQMDPKRYRWA